MCISITAIKTDRIRTNPHKNTSLTIDMHHFRTQTCNKKKHSCLTNPTYPKAYNTLPTTTWSQLRLINKNTFRSLLPKWIFRPTLQILVTTCVIITTTKGQIISKCTKTLKFRMEKTCTTFIKRAISVTAASIAQLTPLAPCSGTSTSTSLNRQESREKLQCQTWWGLRAPSAIRANPRSEILSSRDVSRR